MIVIPMAGESQRFREAGYERPKYMLDVAGRPLFDWTVMSFAAAFDSAPFVFVARDVQETGAFVRERVAALGIANSQVVMLDRPTAGQAETVALGLERIDASNDILTIFNIDTIRPGCALGGSASGAAGWLEVFEGDGSGWSFVLPDPDRPGVALQTAEKVRISNLCSTGLYGFRSRSLFEQALAAERLAPSSPELYIAPIYNHLIAAKHLVAYDRVERPDVIFSGVPEEYEALRQAPSILTERFVGV